MASEILSVARILPKLGSPLEGRGGLVFIPDEQSDPDVQRLLDITGTLVLPPTRPCEKPVVSQGMVLTPEHEDFPFHDGTRSALILGIPGDPREGVTRSFRKRLKYLFPKAPEVEIVDGNERLFQQILDTKLMVFFCLSHVRVLQREMPLEEIQERGEHHPLLKTLETTHAFYQIGEGGNAVRVVVAGPDKGWNAELVQVESGVILPQTHVLAEVLESTGSAPELAGLILAWPERFADQLPQLFPRCEVLDVTKKNNSQKMMYQKGIPSGSRVFMVVSCDLAKGTLTRDDWRRTVRCILERQFELKMPL